MSDETVGPGEILSRMTHVLLAIAYSENRENRMDLISQFMNLVFVDLVRDTHGNGSTLTEFAQDVLSDCATDLDYWDPREDYPFYSDDETVLQHVVKALWVIGWEVIERRLVEHPEITDQRGQLTRPPDHVERLLQRLVTVLVVIAACGDPYQRKGWILDFSYLLHGLAEQQAAFTQETWDVLEDVNTNLARYEARNMRGFYLRTLLWTFFRRRESGYDPHNKRSSCSRDATVLRHVARALGAVVREAGVRGS